MTVPTLADPAVAVSSRERPLTVPELIRRAAGSLDRAVGLVWVEGELCEYKRAASGHAYFQLRDRGAGVPAVIWRSDLERVKVTMENGQHLRVRGRLGVYERDGRMQLYVDAIEQTGDGVAAAALAQLKAKLAAEGLFATARKRALPHLPRRIGVVTSQTGAAVRDIIRTIQRRFAVPILVADCVVQGPAAPREICLALERIARTDVDVVIVGRGGGSATDLAAFDDERVVRAVVACPVPVVSAVGHEVDLSLCDLAADHRASTPTAAAELVVPVRLELAAILAKEERRLHREVGLYLTRARHDVERAGERAHRLVERAHASARAQLAGLDKRLGDAHPRAQLARRRAQLAQLERRLGARHPATRLAAARTALDALTQRARVAQTRRRERGRSELALLAGQLHALSPLAVLERGFAVVRHGERVVRDAASIAVGDTVDVRLARGELRARVERVDAGAGTGADQKDST